MIKFLKKRFVAVILAILLVGVVGYMYFGGDDTPTYEFTVAEKRDIIQEVYVTGRVKSAESVDLAFERGGKVARVYANVGEKVSEGQTLAALGNSEVSLQIAQAQDNLDSAKIALEKLKQPAKTLNLLEAENALAKAEESKLTAEVDLQKAYDDGFNTIANAFADLPEVMAGLEDMMFDNTIDPGSSGGDNITWYVNQPSYQTGAKDKAISLRDDVYDAYNAARIVYTKSFDKYRSSSRSSDTETIESLISEIYDTTKIIADAIKTINNYIDFVQDDMEQHDRTIPSEVAAHQSNINTYTTATNGHLLALLDIKDTIRTSKDTIVNSDRTIAEKTETLSDLKSGSKPLDIKAQEITVRQRENALKEAQVQLAKTIIRSPISGIVTKQNAKVGEIISANTIAISLLSDANFEIEANIPEADIAKVSKGNISLITLDAYGRDVEFEAKVVSIEPAETIIEGVATYKTVFQFVEEDERIKSGMTAKITISTDKREEVVAVPQRAIIRRNGNLLVRILEGDNIKEATIETGLRGSDGHVEIMSGVSEGDKIITFSEDL
jgi:RND family efflux transporter MFP subunit